MVFRGKIKLMAEKKFIDDREQLEKLAPMLKAPIKRHVFVCNGKSCSAVGSAEVKSEFARILEEKGLRQGKESKGRNPMGEILLTDCGSIGFCSIGTAVMVYPDGTRIRPGHRGRCFRDHREPLGERQDRRTPRLDEPCPTATHVSGGPV